MYSSQINASFRQLGPPSAADSSCLNSFFCVRCLSGTLAMETSTSRAAEKKDKMEGNGFSDLPKKPSETRGNMFSENVFSQEATGPNFVSGWSVGPLVCRHRSMFGAQPEAGGKGGANTDNEIYISKIKCHLGSRCRRLSSGPIRYRQQSEVTYIRCLIRIPSRPGFLKEHR